MPKGESQKFIGRRLKRRGGARVEGSEWISFSVQRLRNYISNFSVARVRVFIIKLIVVANKRVEGEETLPTRTKCRKG